MEEEREILLSSPQPACLSCWPQQSIVVHKEIPGGAPMGDSVPNVLQTLTGFRGRAGDTTPEIAWRKWNVHQAEKHTA